MHASDVGQPLPTRRPRQDKIRVLRHPKEPEIHFAEQRSALQEQFIAEALPESPEQPREIEILLDELRLHPLACRRLAAQIGEQSAVRQPWKLDCHRSFSTTLQRRLKVPLRGAPGSIDSTDFVFATRL